MKRKIKNTIQLRSEKLLRSESGFVFELVTILVPSLMLLVALVINTNGMAYNKTKLQSISDSSAHAGAVVMTGPTKEAWVRAQEGAVEALRKYADEYPELADLNLGDGTTWSGNTLAVEIKRGQYQVANSELPGNFVSLEEGENPYRGVDPWLLANGVHVAIKLKENHIFFPVIGDNGFSVGQTNIVMKSTATIDPINPTPVAPFALHYCSLYSEFGEFDPIEICSHDKNFGVANPTWGPGPFNEFARPTYLYDPGPSPVMDRTIWGAIETANYFEYWGVIGRPAQAFGETVTREEVEAMLDPNQSENSADQSFATGMTAHLGQPFAVLHDGLDPNDVGLGNKIWERIARRETDPSRHFPFSEMLKGKFSGPTYIQPNWVPFSRAEWYEWTDLRGVEGGLCNSRRFSWNGCVDGDENGTTASCDPRHYGKYMPSEAGQVPSATGQVWRIQIPVIADQNMSASNCPHFTSNMIDPNGRYFIVGFVTANFYDTDIGLPSPNLKDFQPDGVGLVMGEDSIAQSSQNLMPPWMWPPSFNHPESQYKMWRHFPACNNPGCGLGPHRRDVYIQDEHETPPNLYHPEPCGIIRARISCDTDFVARTRPGNGPLKARIVE